MKNSAIRFASILTFSVQSALAWFPETEYRAANQFLYKVGIPIVSETHLTNSWSNPGVFISRDGTTNSVLVEKTVTMPSGLKHVLRCSASNETADVSVNVYAFLKAQETGQPVELCCAIGDDTVDGRPYAEIVEICRNYIRSVGGFEKFAEWGLV